MIELSLSPFTEVFGEPATIDGQPVNIIWVGRPVHPQESGFDFDIAAEQLKIEIQEQDKDKFTKDGVFKYRGLTFSVFRAPSQNLQSWQWEVDLEP